MSDLDRSKVLLETIPRAMRFIRAEIRKTAGSEFTTPQYRLLARVSRDPGSANSELADWMGVSAPTMSKMIDNLVGRGLVRREAEATDRRQVRVYATPEGQAKAREIRSAVQKLLARRIAALPDKSKRDLSAGLDALKELLT